MFNSPLKDKGIPAGHTTNGNIGEGQAMAAVPVLQNKVVQTVAVEEDEPVVQRQENHTGLPGDLKSGIENLSGMAMDDVNVHYNSDQPAQLNALAYAQGTDIHIGAGQEQHLPHEAWHVVQQKQGRVQPTLQMRQGLAVNDDQGLEREADSMGAAALQYKSAPFSVGQKVSYSGSNSNAVTQRWVVPGEDALAAARLTELEQVKTDLGNLRTSILVLKNRIPAKLRRFWDQEFLAVIRATDLRVAVDNALRLGVPATRTLIDLTNDAQRSVADLAALQADFVAFRQWYIANENDITARVDLHEDIFAHPMAAAKVAQWKLVTLAIQDMDTANILPRLATFNASPVVGLGAVEAARLPGAVIAEKAAVIDLLTQLFRANLARLDTWAKSYPTNYDLKTGEFGAEWHVRSSYLPGMNGKWVFHAHCETIRNGDGIHTGFRFKDILGTNHLKMTSERMVGGVQLDLPLTRGDLDNMAAPYQAAFVERYTGDSVFRETLKKGK